MLLTATDVESGSLAGAVFWRDLPTDEVREWLESPRSCAHTREIAPRATSWTKIELLETAPDFRGHRLGSLLLAAALAYSVVRQHKKSAVLQLAGGSNNVAGSRLYRKFGFEPSTGVFGPPNENLHVLWDIEHSLRDLRIRDRQTEAFQESVHRAEQAALEAPGASVSVKELKRLLLGAGCDISSCVEKQDLVQLATELNLL